MIRGLPGLGILPSTGLEFEALQNLPRHREAIDTLRKPPSLATHASPLRLNAYRVLLTRGREGIVIFVPPAPAMQPTFDALVRAGALNAERLRLAEVA